MKPTEVTLTADTLIEAMKKVNRNLMSNRIPWSVTSEELKKAREEFDKNQPRNK